MCSLETRQTVSNLSFQTRSPVRLCHLSKMTTVPYSKCLTHQPLAYWNIMKIHPFSYVQLICYFIIKSPFRLKSSTHFWDHDICDIVFLGRNRCSWWLSSVFLFAEARFKFEQVVCSDCIFTIIFCFCQLMLLTGQMNKNVYLALVLSSLYKNVSYSHRISEFCSCH